MLLRTPTEPRFGGLQSCVTPRCGVRKRVCWYAGQKKGGMSSEQLLHLAQSLVDKRMASYGSSEGYEAVVFYVYLLKVSPLFSRPPALCITV
jgi:hypothetical protein